MIKEPAVTCSKHTSSQLTKVCISTSKNKSKRQRLFNETIL